MSPHLTGTTLIWPHHALHLGYDDASPTHTNTRYRRMAVPILRLPFLVISFHFPPWLTPPPTIFASPLFHSVSHCTLVSLWVKTSTLSIGGLFHAMSTIYCCYLFCFLQQINALQYPLVLSHHLDLSWSTAMHHSWSMSHCIKLSVTHEKTYIKTQHRTTKHQERQ